MLQYFVTNAFTSTPFSGNPATVCVPVKAVASSLTTHQMHRLAAELSAVETAFVLPPSQPKIDFDLRFFTAKKENPFCGHATIAAAHILSSEYGFRSNEFFFNTPSGLVIVKRKNGKFFELNLRPSLPEAMPSWGTDPAITNVLKALRFQNAAGVPLPDVAANILAVSMHTTSKNLIIMMKSAWAVMAARPDFAELVKAAPPNTNKVTITAIPVQDATDRSPFATVQATGEKQSGTADDEATEREVVERKWRRYDFITRLFAPWFGINEDAVSGASHAILAKLWCEHSEATRAKATLTCFQPSPRGGEVMVDIHDADRIGVSGEAVSIAHGTTTFMKSHM